MKLWLVKSDSGFYVSESFPGTFGLTSDYASARRFEKAHANLLAGAMNESGVGAKVVPFLSVTRRQVIPTARVRA